MKSFTDDHFTSASNGETCVLLQVGVGSQYQSPDSPPSRVNDRSLIKLIWLKSHLPVAQIATLHPVSSVSVAKKAEK